MYMYSTILYESVLNLVHVGVTTRSSTGAPLGFGRIQDRT